MIRKWENKKMCGQLCWRNVFEKKMCMHIYEGQEKHVANAGTRKCVDNTWRRRTKRVATCERDTKKCEAKPD